MGRRQSPPGVRAIAFAATLAASCLVAGHMAVAQPADDTNDPYENTNRAIFGFNQDVDRTVLVPVANAYRAVLPQPTRDSIHDFLQNLNGPIIFANDILQGEFGLATETFNRTVVNTTLGLGGFIDVATKVGMPYHTNDLGITLATWGVSSGPYLMLPVLGPSNPRDLFGDVADSAGDPGNYFASQYHRLYASFARGATSGIDERSRNIESLAEIERTSLDYYATIRSLARQRRAAQIRHQKEDVPNAAPLQGASVITPPPKPETLASAPTRPTAPMSYSVAQPNSVADMQKSPMTPSTANGR
jgi:phospholipid-binding lipoprotein MlaA